MKTKERILSIALSLFNKHGFGSVTMKQIADEMLVDRRNLTYHFSKDTLLEAIADQMWAKLDAERKKRRDFPSFENLDSETKMYYAFQKEYAFIFNDIKVIQHPVLKDKFNQLATSSIQDHEAAIAFAIKLGNIRPEPFKGAYHNLCLSVWALSMFWVPQQAIRKIQDPEELRQVMWSLILPHFTEKGIQSFKEFFGAEFFDTIGKPFDVDVNMAFF